MKRVAAELALMMRDARVRWIGAGLVLLLALTSFGAWREAQRYTTQAAQVTTAERERWLGQDAKNPHSADHFGLWVFRPSAPLAVLDPGTEPYTGRMVRVEAHVFNDTVYRAVQDAGPLARTGLGSIADRPAPASAASPTSCNSWSRSQRSSSASPPLPPIASGAPFAWPWGMAPRRAACSQPASQRFSSSSSWSLEGRSSRSGGS
ncbi:hypothetical protein J2W77_003498 [Methylorubrum extorquens]|nr:hypothetical protein [Methylorubrum extorquens]